jgi:exodeoxyribonuclease VII large subunit
MAALRARSPARELVLRRDRLVGLHRRLTTAPPHALQRSKDRFHHVEGILRVLGPDATLRRGYSITTDDRGKLIRSITAVRRPMKIRTRIVDGEFGSEVL